MVKNLPCNTEDWGSVPDLGTKIPQAGNFPGGLVAKTPCFKHRRPGFDPWSGNQQAATEDLICCNGDQKSHVSQLRVGTGKQIID